MRQLRLDVAAVSADQAGWVDHGVIDPEVESLSDQSLGQFHIRALAQVIRVRLEAQPEQGHSVPVRCDNAIHDIADD